MTIRSDLSPTTDLAIETGQHWTASAERLERHDGLEIDLRHAVIWRPERLAGTPDRACLKHGLHHLQTLLLEQHAGDDGLIRLVLDDEHPRSGTERAAKPHIEALKDDLPRWLLDDARPDPRPAIQLLGLGPGLTPSGDDLLAGILIAWHHLSASAAANRLSHHLIGTGEACTRTTPISLAHLEAAARGYGASPLHQLLNALIVNRRLEIADALDAAAKIGHSSGLDAIAGMVLAMTAWLQADKTPIMA
ncbi:MAG: DUF2877 domain-containing protein [Pseudomonadota bacterium]